MAVSFFLCCFGGSRCLFFVFFLLFFMRFHFFFLRPVPYVVTTRAVPRTGARSVQELRESTPAESVVTQG